MKSLWQKIVLTRTFWNGPEPESGDALRTSTGRTYEILKVNGKRLHCRVVPEDTRIEGRVFKWIWNKRK